MKQVLITGATGFIGGRLAEVACGRGIPTVGLVRVWSRAARLARLHVRMVGGDILNPDSLREAMKGCDVVFHCAVDNRIGGRAHRRTSARGTANVLQAALETGVKRVVHLSSTAVHSYNPGLDAVTEEGAYRYSGDPYCDGKIDSEKVALHYWHKHGLPVTVLRPTIVYGPFGFLPVYTANLIRERRMVLVDGGTGICNSLYVDNLVEAMLRAAEHQGAVGEVFHISDARPISWKEFIEAHARALGDSYLPLPEMSTQEIAKVRERAAGTKLITSSWEQVWRLVRDPQIRQALASIPIVNRSVQMTRSLARAVLPEPTRHVLRQRVLYGTATGLSNGTPTGTSGFVLSQAEVDVFSTFNKVTFKIEKALRIMGFEPRIDFDEGMRYTTAWIQWAGL
jgi:nucleoside-diphosphate-sugar epimerase